MTGLRFGILSIVLGFTLIAVAYISFHSRGIAPDAQPSYRFIQNASAASTFAFGDVVKTKSGEITIWQGTIFGSDTVMLNLEKIVFTNSGTATEADVASYSLYSHSENGTLVPLQENVSPNASAGVEISFPNTALLAGSNLQLVLTAKMNSNARSGKTIILKAEATKVVSAHGTLVVTTINEQVESRIVTAGTENIPVGVFSFVAAHENLEIKNLAVKINEIDTTGLYAPALNQADVLDDASAIKKVSLFHNDGTAVKKVGGEDAVVTVPFLNGEVLFQDLNLIIEDGIQTSIEVRVDLNDMAESMAKSGHAFSMSLDLGASDTSIQGVDSATLLQDDDITVEDEVTEKTFPSGKIYVFNNKVIVERSASQPSGLLASGANQELLKFDAEFTGDTNNPPYLHQVTVNIASSDGACVSADGDCTTNNGTVYLYNGDNALIASAVNTGSGKFILTVDNDANENLGGDIVKTEANDSYVNSETYTIRADVYTLGADSALTATINVNSDAFGQDDVIWIDGTDVLAVQWIDLGVGTSVSKIENTLSN